MGRSLRSRTVKSVSPPKEKKVAGRASAKPKAAPAAAKAKPAKTNARAKAAAPKETVAAKKPTAKNTRGKRQPKKEESSESEEEEIEENESEEEEESGSEGESESESDEAEVVKKAAPAPTKKQAKTPTKAQTKKAVSPKKEESSEESGSEEEDGSEDEDESEDDEVKKVAPKPLAKAKQATKKEESSEEEEESGSEESDDEMEEVTPAPLKKSKSPAKKEETSEEEESGDSEDDADDKGFTDENANWLKPKQKLMSSDEEEGEDDDELGPAGSDDDDEEMLDVERQSRLIDAEMKLEQEEAESELRRTIAQQTSIYHLPTVEELEDDENRVVPPSELRARIEDILEVLADFKARREPGRSRSEYVERLGQDMAELFGYLQELVDYFLSMFGPNECLEFLEGSEKQRPLVVRVNTLKARRKDLAAALMKRGVRLDPLAPWSKVGLKIYESTVPIGATPEYLAGHYMLQSAASMCPVMALGPQPGDRVMDMSAAPGGKTSYISQLMRNKGVVIANDLKPERQKATVANLHRLGVRNVVSCCYDGRKIGAQMRNSFDRILLDAPCSGLGVISRDPSVKVQRTILDVQRCAHLQKELLVAAVDALNHRSKKGGGYMVYSTCSIAVAENEEVINYLLAKRDVKLVDTGLDFGKPGFTRFEHKRFHPSVALTRRFYPHVHNMDGFYVAKIQKLSDKRKDEEVKIQAEKAAVVQVEDDKKKVEAGGGDSKKKLDARDAERRARKKKKRGKGSKRGENNDEPNEIPQKKAKISYPDQKNSQKKKTNAKVSKPRRMKITGM